MNRSSVGGVFASLLLCACGGRAGGTAMMMPAVKEGVRLFLSIDGNGKVAAAPAMTECKGPKEACDELSSDATVTLTATPDTGFEFLGWEYIDGMPVTASVDGCMFEYVTLAGPVDVDLTTTTLELPKGASAPAQQPACAKGTLKGPSAYRIVAAFSSME